MFTVCVSQQHWWSDLLLAVMLVKGGGERAGSHCSCTCRFLTRQLLLVLAGSHLIQVSISAQRGQHFGISCEYLWCQLVHKSYVTW